MPRSDVLPPQSPPLGAQHHVHMAVGTQQPPNTSTNSPAHGDAWSGGPDLSDQLRYLGADGTQAWTRRASACSRPAVFADHRRRLRAHTTTLIRHAPVGLGRAEVLPAAGIAGRCLGAASAHCWRPWKRKEHCGSCALAAELGIPHHDLDRMATTDPDGPSGYGYEPLTVHAASGLLPSPEQTGWVADALYTSWTAAIGAANTATCRGSIPTPVASTAASCSCWNRPARSPRRATAAGSSTSTTMTRPTRASDT
jgi:hypothetical protein